MNKKPLGPALGLLPLAVFFASPCLALADPTPAASPASGGDAALITRVNGLYCNYKSLGLHKLKCEVKVSMFDNLLRLFQSKYSADDSRVKALRDVRFFMNYDEKNGFKFSYSNYKPTGDPAIDNNLAKALQGVGQVVDGFCKSWSAITFEPAIDPSKAAVTVEKTADGYVINEKKASAVSKNILNGDLLITEVDGYSTEKPDMVLTIKPTFEKTGAGLLITSMNVSVPQAMNETIDIQYQEVQKFSLPSQAVMSIDMLGSEKADITLLFSNYQLN